MDEGSQPELIFLCRQRYSLEWVLGVASERFRGVDHPVMLRTWSGELREACQRARAEHGGVPLGVVVANETEGLVAIEAGADESVLESHLDASSVLAFIDRTMLRARLRREQEQLSTTFVHSEKLVALGTLVAGVAHEVNNPLTSMLLSAEGLKLSVGPLCSALSAIEELSATKHHATREDLLKVIQLGLHGAPLTETQELLREIESSAQAIARVVRDLKLFARPDDEAAPEIIDVRVLLDQVLRLVGRQVRKRAVIELDYAPDLPPVVAPSARLTQVITNVLLNAAHAIDEIERPAHRIRISVRADEEAVAVSVTDTGPGIAPNVIRRIFDPFFTTKRQGVGTGLGLSISRSILRRLGGDLLVESVHGDGATFIALIPLPDAEALQEARRHSSATTDSRAQFAPHQRILLVDSNERVLESLARALDDQFDILSAHDGQEAIELLSSGSRADLIVADVSRPELAGIVLRDWLRVEGNRLHDKIIYMTAEEESSLQLLGELGGTLLRKPVSRGVLLSAISDLVAREDTAFTR